jgi:hypothetical protein
MEKEYSWKKIKEREDTITYGRKVGNLEQSLELEKSLIEVIKNENIKSV